MNWISDLKFEQFSCCAMLQLSRKIEQEEKCVSEKKNRIGDKLFFVLLASQ